VDIVDWPITRLLGLKQDRRIPLAAANLLSRLGDGPLYVVIAAALLLFRPQGTLAILVCAGVSCGLLHSVYPVLKRFTARPRPRDVRAIFPDAHPALDSFSFPSGHVMTLTATLTPIVHAAPSFWPAGVVAWAAMAWARVAIGHHFASDIAAGTLLGLSVAGGLIYLVG
jgi:undecaprenyl-diphosphatase